ncbi:hypothetical protein Droror1_Dr00022613 [Drosera rotundifolia]
MIEQSSSASKIRDCIESNSDVAVVVVAAWLPCEGEGRGGAVRGDWGKLKMELERGGKGARGIENGIGVEDDVVSCERPICPLIERLKKEIINNVINNLLVYIYI